MTIAMNAYAQEIQTDSQKPFEKYRILLERNIFDPNRRKVEPVFVEPVTAPPTEQISLIGTMIYEKEAFAFFEGTRSEYKTAVRLQDSIAGYRVTKVDTEGIELENEGRQISLPVGMALVREGEGNWQIASASLPSRSRVSVSPSPGNGESGGTDEGDPGDESSTDDSADDMLKKLMERRKRELQQ